MKVKCLFYFLIPLSLLSCDSKGDKDLIVDPFEDVVVDRTIVVYMIGNNSLSSYCKRNIDSISAGLLNCSSRPNILVYEDSKRNADSSDNSDYYSVLWDIKKNDKGEVVVEEVWREFGQNSAKAEVMSDVLNKAYELYPSKEKGLILWSHATGWVPSPQYNASAGTPKLKSFGPDGDDYMEIWDIREALENVPKLDFLCFDACMMANTETVYELKDEADFIIASPTEIWGAGMPYQKIMQPLSGEVLNLRNVCMLFMDHYKSKGCTMSLIKTDKLREIASLYKLIYPSFTDKPSALFSEIQQFGRYISHSANYEDVFFDLADTVDKLLVTEDMGDNFTKADVVRSLDIRINDAVLFTDNTDYFTSIKITTNSGLSIYIPSNKSPSNYLSAYSNLLWYKDVYGE